jgi:hypothetical protein
MFKLLSEKNLRQQLINKGKKQSAIFNNTIQIKKFMNNLI